MMRNTRKRTIEKTRAGERSVAEGLLEKKEKIEN